MKHIIVFGNPVNGFNFAGPFASADAAVRYGESARFSTNWWAAGLDAPDPQTALTPLQRHVADHYEGGEFAHVKTVEEAELVGDTLFTYAIYEAGGAVDAAELRGMLDRAIDQLRSARNELDD